MLKILILILPIVLVVKYLKDNKIEVKIPTFFKKGFLVENGAWGVYCYTGKQGRGKTYSVIEFLNEHKDYKIYSNVSSLKGVRYIYIASFEELLAIQNDTDDNIIIFYDEIFTALTKQSKLTKDVLGFLSQMRKRKIIFLTTAQEWLEINLTLRRYVRFQVDCDIKSFLGRSYLFKTFYDGEQIHWSNIDNDYVAPLISTTISKMNLSIANSYDTYEVIQSSNFNYKKNKNLLTDEGKSCKEEPQLSVSSAESTNIDKTFWNDIDMEEDYEYN